MPIVKKQKITTTSKQKSKLLVDHPHMDSIMKSVRVYEKDGMIYIDYRVHHEYRKEGRDRTRFSTGVVYSKRAMQRVEREMFSIALENYLKTTNVLDGANLTLGNIALDAINEDRGNRQDDVHNDYLKIYEVYIKPMFEHSNLREVKVSDVKAWKNNLLTNHSLSRSRFLKYIRTLNFIFKYALENEMIDRNPVALVDKKSKLFVKSNTNQSEKYYTHSEVEKMLQASEGWFHVLLMTYLNTGMRTGEALGLKFSDIDFDNHTIVIQRSMRKGVLKDGTKTDENRIIRMSKPLKDELLAHQKLSKSDVWVFPNLKTGKPYYEANSITRWYFKPLLKRLGIEYKTLYALRHTFASLSAQRNIPMSAIQKQIGHKKLSTTLDFYVKNNLLSDDNEIDMFDKLYA